MMTRLPFWLFVTSLAGLLSGDVHAGMPSPELIITKLGQRRLEELSFFLVGFLLMAAVVRWLWNSLQVGFPTWPRLTYRRSVMLLVLWGLLMTVVLAMISGARELMTPAAWEPNGVTYTLAGDRQQKRESILSEEKQDQRRRLKLENLRFVLWQFAASHEGRFPSELEAAEMADELWRVEKTSPLRYVYVPGQHLKQPDGVLVYEPELFDNGQYVILTSGAIARLTERTGPLEPLTSESSTKAKRPASVETSAHEASASEPNEGR